MRCKDVLVPTIKCPQSKFLINRITTPTAKANLQSTNATPSKAIAPQAPPLQPHLARQSKVMMKFGKMDYWLLIFSLMMLDLQRGQCLFVTDLNVPEIVDFRDNVTLACSYQMSGHTLNSVKWYKDKLEFFRYSPMMHPVYIKFPVTGVHLPDGRYFCNESSCKVELSMLSAKSSGVYKCEVSGDAPHFQLAAKEDNMTVAALPQSDPLIESFNPMYRMEDYLSATCTSDYSSVTTRLMWYINGDQASLGELQPIVDTSISAHGYDLRRVKLQVHFYLSGPRFFHAGKILNLKCVAEIENFPELSRETSLNAVLIPYDNLNNQMLIHAGSRGTSSLRPGAAHLLSIVAGFLGAVIFSTVLGLSDL